MGPPRTRRWCTRGTLRSECVSKDSARQSTTCRREIIHRGRGRCGAVGGIWLAMASRYPCSARVCVRKIEEYPGPSQHFRPSAVVVDASFFVHAARNCGYYNKGHGAGNVGADGTPEPPFHRVYFSTKSLRLKRARRRWKKVTPTSPHFGVKVSAKQCNRVGSIAMPERAE
jgi:hypothetical protein